MRPVILKSSAMLRICPRQRLPALPAAILAAQRRGKADIVERTSGEYEETPSLQSPFTSDSNPTTKIPSFAKYMSKRGETSNRTFQYFMVGGMGLLTAAGAKATVQGKKTLGLCQSHADLELRRYGMCALADLVLYTTDFLVNMSASADVLAQAKVEIDLSAIPEGKNVFSPRSHVVFIKITDRISLDNCQMAWKACLHPPSHRRRDQGCRGN